MTMDSMTAQTQRRERRDNRATHDVFDVVEQEGARARWNRIGLSYVDDDGRQIVVVRSEAGGSRVLELRAIDRAQRPIPAGREPRMFPRDELLEVNEMMEKRVGVAFVNRDGSLSLVIDEGERDREKKRLQMRRVKARGTRAA